MSASNASASDENETDGTPRLTVEDTVRYRRRVEDAAEALRREIGGEGPSVALVLGAGLREVAEAVDVETAVSYADVPHMPAADGDAPQGRFVAGTLGGTRVVVMEGRLHLYEGYTPRQVVFPIRVLATLGVDTMMMTAAAGGLDPHHEPGDLMLVTDHVNFQGANPLVGPNVDDWGPRFPDMTEPYDADLRRAATEVALDAGIQLHKGVYLAVLGPNLETAAEARMLRTMGADAVGMSTVPEVIAARHMDVRVLALSVLTDVARPGEAKTIPFAEVRETLTGAVPRVRVVVEGVVGRF
jgi:purine-nucleoside phosphorylase